MRVCVVGETNLAQVLRQVLVKYHALVDIWQAELAWIAHDVEVDENDVANLSQVDRYIAGAMQEIAKNATLLISSQIPVGYTRKIMKFAPPDIHWAYMPENVRIKAGVADWFDQDRFVVGVEEDCVKSAINNLLEPFNRPIMFMSIESAEFVKHAINCWLAMSVVFANNMAELAGSVSADWESVEQALRAEHRIGKFAYLRAGEPYTGGTLGRDIQYVLDIQSKYGQSFQLIYSIHHDNTQRIRQQQEKP